MKPQGVVYLIHFLRPYKHARHYLGFSENLDKRITDHLAGMGARLMSVVTEAKIEWKVARTWRGDRIFERRLKNRKQAPDLCPLCSGKKAMKLASGRRGPHGPRPPTPPDVRFRIRRFTLKIETFAVCLAVTRVPTDQSMILGTLRSYATHQHSTTNLARCWRFSRPVASPIRV